MASEERRPAVDAVRTGAELQRWYWLRSELVELARHRGLTTSGAKVELTERLVASLDGRPAPAPARRRPSGDQLHGRLTRDTRIPSGQRSSQALRAFFEQEVGPEFRFDEPMRAFVRDGAGRTLGEAVSHWYATRDRPRGDIAPQFELNRFVRAWFERHPGSTRSEALLAWQEHRALPVDRRSSGEDEA